MDKKHATIANTSFVESSFAENHQHLETPYASPSKTDHRELQEGSGGGICTHLIDQECLNRDNEVVCTYGNNCSITERFCIRPRSSGRYKCRTIRSNDHCKNSDYTICDSSASANKKQVVINQFTPEEIAEAKEAAIRIQKEKDAAALAKKIREEEMARERAQKKVNKAALDSATQAANSYVNNATQRLEDAIAAINQRKAKVRSEFQRVLSMEKESAHKSYQLEATATLKKYKDIIDDWTVQRDNAKNDLKDADELKKKQTENKKVREQAEKIKKDLLEKEIENQVNDNLEKARKEAEKSAALMEDAFLDTDLTASLNEPSYSTNTTNNILESDSNESTSYHENAFLRFLFVLGFFAVVVLIYRRFFKSRVSLSHSMTKSPTCHQSETTFSSANTPDDRAANHAIYTIEGDELFSPKQSYLSIISEVPNHYDAIEDSLLSDDRNSVYNTMYEETTEFESNDSNAGLSIISCESSFSKDDSIAQGGGSIKTSMSSIDNIEL